MEILAAFPVIEARIKVRKLTPPINGNIDYIEVEVIRRQPEPEKLLDSEDSDG